MLCCAVLCFKKQHKGCSTEQHTLSISTDIDYAKNYQEMPNTRIQAHCLAHLHAGKLHGMMCRAKLWRAAIPEQAPVAQDVDWESLGKAYQLAGGSIKQAVVRAATQAALRIEVCYSFKSFL